MQFSTWDTFFNLVLLIFWFQVWNKGERRAYFNPFLASLAHLSNSAVSYVRPVFVGVRDNIIAAFIVAFLIVFRALLVSRGAIWGIAIGFHMSRAVTSNLLGCVVFSVVSFGFFLFQIWAISLIYVQKRHPTAASHPVETIDVLSRPFTDIPAHLRPVSLLAYGSVLVILLARFGVPVTMSMQGALVPPLSSMLQTPICALAAGVDMLLVLRGFLIVLIIGSWVSMFSMSPGVTNFCREWMDLMLGPFRRYPLRVGMIDLTPLVAIFAVQFVHQLLQYILLRGYLQLA